MVGTDTRRVVLIDDAEDLRSLIRVVLERSGRFEVVGEASDGQEGLDVVRRTRPDVVLLDLSMPVMDGLEALPGIAEHAPDATILILSGYSEGAAAESATKAGAHGYIEKGLSPRDLLGRLDSMLGYLTDNHGAPPNRFVPPPDIRIEPNAVLGQLAHDLRSPMLAARGLVQVLASELPTETQERELANRASSALAHLEGLITDALAYARADAASLTLVQLEVGPLIDRVVDGLETAERVEIDSAPGTVVADASALERVIRNLIENAIRYSPGRVTVRSEPSAEERVRISVLDRGPGVDPAEGNDLFRPFFRGSSASASRGSGLGLAACARIVQQLEGRIWAENRDDGGAAFHVELPRGDRNPIF